jgi:hypothetical protein
VVDAVLPYRSTVMTAGLRGAPPSASLTSRSPFRIARAEVEAVARRRSREAQGILVTHRDVPLVDAREPLEIDARAMTGRAHERLGRQAGGGHHAPDAGDAGDVWRRVAVGRMFHEHPRRCRHRRAACVPDRSGCAAPK